MRAYLPPYAEDDPFVWVKDACDGAGAYFRRSRCVLWHDGGYVLREVAAANRAARGITPEEMDARTRSGTSAPPAAAGAPNLTERDDTVRARRDAVVEAGCWPGG